ncbi:MAG: ABC transporter permease subunit [Anaerolineales bacterium]|nr:ABC transporter permease subunit [Anaerolineales bacterium]
MVTASGSLRTSTGSPSWWQRQSVRQWIWQAFVYVILIFVALVMVLPLYWLVVSSFKPETNLFHYPPEFIPTPATLENYNGAITGSFFEEQGIVARMFDVTVYIRNTLTIIIANMIFGVSISALVAYALARLRFRGREFIFYTVIGALFLPGVVMIIPRFVIFSRLDLTNTFWPLIIPGFFGYANQIFFMRQYFMTISNELEDAAYVDGCSTLRFWWQVMLPLAKAALAVQLIITFMYHWNDFLDPLIYLGVSPDRATVQLAIIQVMDPQALRFGVLFAYSTLLVIPCLVVFFLFQRTLIQGVVFTGVKG